MVVLRITAPADSEAATRIPDGPPISSRVSGQTPGNGPGTRRRPGPHRSPGRRWQQGREGGDRRLRREPSPAPRRTRSRRQSRDRHWLDQRDPGQTRRRRSAPAAAASRSSAHDQRGDREHTGASTTWNTLADELDLLTLGTFTGPAGTFRQTAELTKTQRDLFAKLKIAHPKKIIEATPASS